MDKQMSETEPARTAHGNAEEGSLADSGERSAEQQRVEVDREATNSSRQRPNEQPNGLQTR